MKLARGLLVPIVCVLLLDASFLTAQTYKVEQSNTTENLRGLSVPSRSVIWAGGTHGTYLRSLDGGSSWHAAQVPGTESLDFRDVEAFDAKRAYLLSAGPGEQSRIYKTEDGGGHWQLQFTNPDPAGFFDCMAFWDPSHGIAVGDPVSGQFVLIATIDGGRHWNKIPSDQLPPAVEGEGAFAASGTCIATAGKSNVWFATGGKVARVFHSVDAGANWSVADAPIVHGAASAGIFSVMFRNSHDGVIAGGDYKQPEQDGPNLAFTTDGGATWKLAPVSPQFYVSAVAWDAAGSLVVGSTRAAFAEGGMSESWKKIWDLNLNAVRFFAPGRAVAVGPKGAVVTFDLR